MIKLRKVACEMLIPADIGLVLPNLGPMLTSSANVQEVVVFEKDYGIWGAENGGMLMRGEGRWT